MEQSSNAFAVAQLHLGRVMPELCRQKVESWPLSSTRPATGYPDVAGLIARWVDQGEWRDVNTLSALAWDQTENPPKGAN
jgi:hypothetical protein